LIVGLARKEWEGRKKKEGNPASKNYIARPEWRKNLKGRRGGLAEIKPKG